MVTALKPILIGKFGVKPCHRRLKISGSESYSHFVGTGMLVLPAEDGLSGAAAKALTGNTSD
jgi:hypothetical protein